MSHAALQSYINEKQQLLDSSTVTFRQELKNAS